MVKVAKPGQIPFVVLATCSARSDVVSFRLMIADKTDHFHPQCSVGGPQVIAVESTITVR